MFTPFSKRNQQAKGQGEYRYDEFPQPLKVQIIYVWQSAIACFPAVYFKGSNTFYAGVAHALKSELGVFRLVQGASTAEEEVCNYLLQEQDVEKCLDTIEIVFQCLINFYNADSYVNAGLDQHIRIAFDQVNARCKEHAVGYEFHEGKIIRIDSGCRPFQPSHIMIIRCKAVR
jgi:hypothetical protein